MTYAWYGHLKHFDMPMIAAILVRRARRILFPGAGERIGYGRFTGYQLKIMQETITLWSSPCSPTSIWASQSAGTIWRLSRAWPRQ
jgi:uncharacterized protein (DUF486 family)